MEALSLAELRDMMNAAAMHDDPEIQAICVKAAKWLDDLEGIEGTQGAAARFAIESLETELPNFEGMIAASTAHVTKETAEALSAGEVPISWYPHGEHGWLLYVNSEPMLFPESMPVELLTLLDYARKHGCCWLLLDADAAEIEELPTFEW